MCRMGSHRCAGVRNGGVQQFVWPASGMLGSKLESRGTGADSDASYVCKPFEDALPALGMLKLQNVRRPNGRD